MRSFIPVIFIVLFGLFYTPYAYGQSSFSPASETKSDNDLSTLEADNRNLKFRLILVGAFAIVSASGFMVVVSRYHKSLSTTRELAKENKKISAELLAKKDHEKKQIEQELNRNREYLTGFAMEINRKQELLGNLYARLNKIKPQKEKEKGIEDLLKDLRIIMQVEKSHNQLQKEAELINSDFYSRLEKEYPQLSENERQFAGLIRMGLSNKEIALIRQINANSAKVYRHRLCKKIGINSSQELEELLLSI